MRLLQQTDSVTLYCTVLYCTTTKYSDCCSQKIYGRLSNNLKKELLEVPILAPFGNKKETN